MIITQKGKNIFPEEIEFLLDRVPYIKESMVYGDKNNISGDVVVSAMLVLDTEKKQSKNFLMRH